MKIRIKGNSIRLRLAPSEVAEFASVGWLEEHTAFGGGTEAVLSYRIEKKDVNIVTARFCGGRITVTVPASIVDEWAAAEQLGFSGRQVLDDGSVLDILVEKDLACPKPRSGEDISDDFPDQKQKDTC